MKTSSLIIAAAITAGSFSASAQAQDSRLENFVGSLVEQAVAITTSELGNSARQLVANASHMFELDASTVNTRVSVTDLVAEQPKKADEQDTGE